MPLALEMKSRSNTLGAQLALHIPSAFKNKGVVAIGGVRIFFTEALVNENGDAKLVACTKRCIERRVVVRAQSRSHPVEDVGSFAATG